MACLLPIRRYSLFLGAIDLVATFVLSTILLQVAVANPPIENEGVESELGNTVSQLIEELGGRTYKQRERATRQLIEKGWRVLPYMEMGLQHGDREIRQRSQRVCRILEQQFQQQRLAAFVAHPSRDEVPLPGWERLKMAIGDTPAARSMIVEILTEHWELLERFEKAAKLNSDLESGQQVVQELAVGTPSQLDETPASIFQIQLEQLRFRRDRQHLPLSIGQVAAILLMSNDPVVPFDDRQSSNILSILHRFSRATNGENPWQNSAFLQLASQYLKRCTSRKNAYQACSLALRYNIPEGVVPAVAMVESRLFPAHELQYGILAIAKLGGPEHIAIVESTFDDQRVCFRRAMFGRSQNVDCQVRDVGLAAVIHLAGENPRSYGFDHIQKNSYSVFQLNSLYFLDDAARMSGFAKWNADQTAESPVSLEAAF